MAKTETGYKLQKIIQQGHSQLIFEETLDRLLWKGQLFLLQHLLHFSIPLNLKLRRCGIFDNKGKKMKMGFFRTNKKIKVYNSKKISRGSLKHKTKKSIQVTTPWPQRHQIGQFKTLEEERYTTPSQ